VLKSPLCNELLDFIKQQVNQGVVHFTELKRNTDLFISREVCVRKKQISKFNRRYALTRTDFVQLVCKERDRLSKALLDNDRVVEKVNSWQTMHADDSFLLRLTNDVAAMPAEDHDRFILGGTGKEGFLFVYQSVWQKRLLLRYGGICLLIAAYRTVKYPTPVYLLYVRTNANYIVVATFALQYEDDCAIAEALRVVQDWNVEWKPWSFMVDFSSAEITAVKNVFPGLNCCCSNMLIATARIKT